jgi:hypothetical protein
LTTNQKDEQGDGCPEDLLAKLNFAVRLLYLRDELTERLDELEKLDTHDDGDDEQRATSTKISEDKRRVNRSDESFSIDRSSAYLFASTLFLRPVFTEQKISATLQTGP